MIDQQHVVDRTAAYALGALPADEARGVEAHCSGCAACAADLAEMKALAATLPLACDAHEPSTALRRRILDEARADASAGDFLRSVRRPPPRTTTWWAAAAAVLVLGASGLAGKAMMDRARMAAQVQEMSVRVAADEQALDDIAGARRVWDMSGGTHDHWWHCTLVQPLNGKPAMLVAQMPVAPKGMTFQAWVIRKGAVHDAGMVAAGTKSMVHLPMPVQRGDVVAFTIEPMTGSPRPTMPFAMQATLD